MTQQFKRSSKVTFSRSHEDFSKKILIFIRRFLEEAVSKRTSPVFWENPRPPLTLDQVISRCSSYTHYLAFFVLFQNL